MVKVIFLHPDLGIGGAERLVVDAGLALKRRKHDVAFYTSHHDTSHCFPETVDGSLSVTCVGDWLPRSFGGHLMALCAYIRMIFLAFYVRFVLRVDYDVAIVDQVSACVPLLSGRSGSKVLFYCHYPDQLLTQRDSMLKTAYRFFLDWVEETTTRCADSVLVNSQFTAGVFQKTFRSIRKKPAVLYPSLDFSKFDACPDSPLSQFGLKEDYDVLFVSLNRFERKKNLSLALYALKQLLATVEQWHLQNIGKAASISDAEHGEEDGASESKDGTVTPSVSVASSDEKTSPDGNSTSQATSGNRTSASSTAPPPSVPRIHLVMAGGYDTRNIENIQHYNELLNLTSKLNLSQHVTFLKSPSETCKVNLLRKSTCLIYTPSSEHFGIVPIEAMYCRTPVIAVDSGGPKETVMRNTTGFLCQEDPQSFADAMFTFVSDGEELRGVMGQAGHERVVQRFSFDSFTNNLHDIVLGLCTNKKHN